MMEFLSNKPLLITDTILRDAQGIYPIAMSEFDCDPYILN